MTLRLTSRSLAGTFRKLVAVGTSRLASMLATMRAAAPRRGSPGGWAGASVVCAGTAPVAVSAEAAGVGAVGFAGVGGALDGVGAAGAGATAEDVAPLPPSRR